MKICIDKKYNKKKSQKKCSEHHVSLVKLVWKINSAKIMPKKLHSLDGSLGGQLRIRGNV